MHRSPFARVRIADSGARRSSYGWSNSPPGGSNCPLCGQCLDASQLGRAARLRDPMQRRDRELVHALHRTALGIFSACLLPAFRCGAPRMDSPGCRAMRCIPASATRVANAAIAISTAGPVGVDIEPRSRNFPMAELADRICHPDELPSRRVRPAAPLGSQGSALKAIGTGLSMEMSSFAAPDGALVSLRPDPSSPRDDPACRPCRCRRCLRRGRGRLSRCERRVPLAVAGRRVGPRRHRDARDIGTPSKLSKGETAMDGPVAKRAQDWNRYGGEHGRPQR